MTDKNLPAGYARKLGLFSATMLVVGGIIGSGVFRNAGEVVSRVKTPQLTMLSWGLGGVIALIGAFIFAELGQRRPTAGGGYAYLREAFGPVFGFLYAWALLLVIATGAIAAVAMTCASYATSLFDLPDSYQPLIAGGAILFLTVINVLGVTPAAWTQNLFTILKLAAVAVLIGAIFMAPPHQVSNVVITAPTSTVMAIGAALVPVLFAFGGWQQTNFVAEELIDAEKNLPRALLIGVSLVVVVYLLVNLAYLRAIDIEVLAKSTAPAADAMFAIAGETGRKLISAGIVASTFGFLNLVILVSPRVYQAMARDGLFFRAFAKIDPVRRTPVNAIVFQGVWAALLLVTKTYGNLLDYVVFADWIFFGLTAATIFALRQIDGDKPITFKVPLHPLSTGAFILSALYVVIGSVISNPDNALYGAGLLILGLPVFFYWQGRRSRNV